MSFHYVLLYLVANNRQIKNHTGISPTGAVKVLVSASPKRYSPAIANRHTPKIINTGVAGFDIFITSSRFLL
jgi:hypothetical protein